MPTSVLQQASQGLLNYGGTGMGVCELSHRGKEFKSIIEGAEGQFVSSTLKTRAQTHSKFEEAAGHP